MIAREVFEKAISLIDEISPDTGFVDTDTTDDYFARSPYLIDLLQKDLAKQSGYTKKIEVDYTPTESQQWFTTLLPEDLDSVERVTIEGNERERINYYIENNGFDKELLIELRVPCTVKIIYKAIPPKVNGLDDVLVLDDLTLNAMAYGLAKKFIEVEQNDFLVSIFTSEYDRQRAIASFKKPVSIEKMTNAYGRI